MHRFARAAVLLVAASGCEQGGGSADGDGLADEAGTDEAGADAADADGGTPVDCAALVAIDEASLDTHLQALVAIASEHGGNRAAGTPGYDASAAYVRDALAAAGYVVEEQRFDVAIFSLQGDPVFEQTHPMSVDYGGAFNVPDFSGSGDVQAAVRPIDVELGLDNDTSSGCEPEDFESLEPGEIALVQRGNCTFAGKVQEAQAAGAAAVILFNRGSTENNQDAFTGTLGASAGIDIPVVFTSYAVGVELIDAGEDGAARVVVDALVEDKPTVNLIAQTAAGDPTDVLMYGAHLDSVPAGPGINDNGSGTAALLEIARALPACPPTKAIRFAWWGAEEMGLLGSQHYVDALAPEERANLRFYLNFDMVASPNFVRFVYDGDGSAFELVGPGNSAELEAVFADYFVQAGVPSSETAFSGRSDYAAFIDIGVPAGGLFTGAEGDKTEAEQTDYGGNAGEAYDECYHRACDGADNVDLGVLREMTGAAAHTIELYALTTGA